MDQELYEAYRQTTYGADTPRGRLALRIGQHDLRLDLLLADHGCQEWGCQEWAYLTAYNPQSTLRSDEENRARQTDLENTLRAGGWACFAGESAGTRGDWPPEPSFLVLGIPEATARLLGKQFGQNAIVVGRLGKPAELVWLG